MVDFSAFIIVRVGAILDSETVKQQFPLFLCMIIISLLNT